MSTTRGRFPHYEKNGMWVSKPITTRPVAARLASRTPRTTYKGDGICLGAVVTGRTAFTPCPTVTGQIWSECGLMGLRGYWWVVDAEGKAWPMHESNMTLEGQAYVDGELFSA